MEYLKLAEIYEKIDATTKRLEMTDHLVDLFKSTPPNLIDKLIYLTQVLNVHISTIRRWSNMGLITTYRIGPRGDRRFKMDDIQRILDRPL